MSVMDYLKNLGKNKEDFRPPESEGATDDPHRALVNQIRRAVSQGCRFDNSDHPPTTLAVLGALAGFGCQTAVREGLIKSGKLTEAKAFEVVQTLDGDNYYHGEELNKMLMLNPNSVYAIICGGLMKADCRDYPDLEASFKKVLESFGGPAFGRPDVPPEYQPRISPLDGLRRFWPELLPTVAPHWRGPGQPKLNPLSIGSLFAAAAHLAIVDYRDRIPPAVAGQLVFEAALSMSGINPAGLPEAPPAAAAGPAAAMAAPQAAAAPKIQGQAAAPAQPAAPQAASPAPAQGAACQPSGQQLPTELSRLVLNTVVQNCVFDGVPHAPTALATLGALAGFACQTAVRDGVVKTGQMPASEALTVAQAPDGSRYYSGPLLDQPLLRLPTSVYAIICQGMREAGATEFPDPEATQKKVLATLGSPSFGWPDLPPAHQLKARPLDCLKHFWPQLYPRISRYYGDPAQGGLAPISLGWIFATAAGWAIISAKDALPPALSGPLALETALSLARLDPALLGPA